MFSIKNKLKRDREKKKEKRKTPKNIEPYLLSRSNKM